MENVMGKERSERRKRDCIERKVGDSEGKEVTNIKKEGNKGLRKGKQREGEEEKVEGNEGGRVGWRINRSEHKCEQTGRRKGSNQTHRKLNPTCHREAGGEGSGIKHSPNFVRHREEMRHKSNAAKPKLSPTGG